jgi:SAM-dependent methyltransferase
LPAVTRAMSLSSQTEALSRVLGVLLPALDIVNGRVEEAEPPAFCTKRGWSEFLLSLTDEEVRRCEAAGLTVCAPELSAAPESLLALAAGVREQTTLPALGAGVSDGLESPIRNVSARKRSQLDSLAEAVRGMAEHATRIVDVGSGSGHFAMLAAERFGRDTLGIERDADRVLFATRRIALSPQDTGRAHFVTSDACREPLSLSANDLAVGLHACGELGDTLVRAAASARCDIALISCCFQKISGVERAPLCRALQGVAWRRAALGLANETAQSQGIEDTIGRNMESRQTRYALRCLLVERGQSVPWGAEMRGINRRRAHGGLRALAERALALRGLAPPTDAELRHHEAAAPVAYGRIRRFALARSMLARLVELAVVLDRAAALEESGQHVLVGTLFERSVTPRNIALFASSTRERLPF